jgi:hypothetical protein
MIRVNGRTERRPDAASWSAAASPLVCLLTLTLEQHMTAKPLFRLALLVTAIATWWPAPCPAMTGKELDDYVAATRERCTGAAEPTAQRLMGKVIADLFLARVDLGRATVTGFGELEVFNVDGTLAFRSFTLSPCSATVEVPNGHARTMAGIPALERLRQQLRSNQTAARMNQAANQGARGGELLGILAKGVLEAPREASSSDYQQMKPLRAVYATDTAGVGVILVLSDDMLLDQLRVGREAGLSFTVFATDAWGTLLGVLHSVSAASGFRCANGHTFDASVDFKFCPHDGSPLGRD